MGDNEPLKKSLTNLLKYLQVERVVCVDDDTPSADLDESLLGKITEDTPLPKAFTEQLKEPVHGELAARNKQLTEAWARVQGFRKRQKAIFELNEELGAPPDGSTLFSTELKSLIAPIRVENISPIDWERSKKDGKYPYGEKALILFDLDLHNASMGEEGGVSLARNYLSAHPEAYCGIATHHAKNSAEADALEVSFESAEGVDREHVFVLTKESITNTTDEFAIRLKRMVLRPTADQLRKVAIGALNEAHSKAMDAFGKIDVLQLADVVNSAHEDGAWEMDSLRRLYNLEVRDALRVAERKAGIPEAANNVFKVRKALPEFPGIAQENAKFQSRERYEPGSSINPALLPVQLGDVFTFEDKSEWVLLVQACDLLLRTKGPRAARFGFMVPIKKEAPNAKALETVFALDWYFDDSESKSNGAGYATFKKAFPVPLFPLDLAAYNTSGSCRLASDDVPPTGLHDAATKRFQLLYDESSTLAARLAEGQTVELPTPPHGCPELRGRITQGTPWILSYSCRRSRRIAMPYAVALLAKYTQFLSRTAFERAIGEATAEQPTATQ